MKGRQEVLTLALVTSANLCITSDHSMRSKYRSAVYTIHEEQIDIAKQAIRKFQVDFEHPIITKVIGLKSFKLNAEKYLEKAELPPAELVIINMNEPASELTSHYFSIRSFEFKSEERLPLAAARNFAAEQAAHPFMIFLDVDCIPSPLLVERYFNAHQKSDDLWIGPVRYLRPEATMEPDFLSKMMELSLPDPVRGNLQEVHYAYFWSLNFACSKNIYARIGGFDTRFTGYGAEDTDFSFTAREREVPLSVVDAVAYHQYHPSYDPPLNHFEDILVNARTFFEKWKIWPMEGWLRKFVNAGLIEWKDDKILILRKPNETKIRAALKSG